jgi:hypothetical protein
LRAPDGVLRSRFLTLASSGTSGTASGSFLGTRWFVQSGLTGTYPWQKLVLEPSARVFALWEHENAYTDSLGRFQPARSFETDCASAGVKAIYPFAWTSSVALSPYAGLYADYYFSRDDAQTVGLTTVPLLQGWSARLTGGVAATFAGGASLGAGGELGRHRQRQSHLDLDRARPHPVLVRTTQVNRHHDLPAVTLRCAPSARLEGRRPMLLGPHPSRLAPNSGLAPQDDAVFDGAGV